MVLGISLRIVIQVVLIYEHLNNHVQQCDLVLRQNVEVTPNNKDAEKYYTCDDGTWYMGNYVATPTWYSSCRLPYDCPAQNWCPSEKWWNDTVPCVTYSESSAYYNRCDRVKITSYCHDWNWTPTPWSYTYCTNISWGPDTWGGSTGGTVSYKWTKISGTCSTGSVTTTSCTPWANCSTSGKTCCLGGTYYTCK